MPAHASASVGNVLFATLVAASLTHGIGSVGHFKSWWTLSAFGQNWDAEGFCIAHKGTVFDSHLLSLYGQIVLAAVLYVAASKSSATGRTELAVVSGHAESVLSHGFGHGFIYLIADERGGLSREQPLVTAATPLLIAAALLLISVFFFWNLLQRTSFPPLLRAAQAIVAAFVIPTMLPTIMVFGITGAVIFGNLHLDLLCHGRASDGAQTAQTSRNLSTFHPVSNNYVACRLCGKKDRFYALYGAFQSVSMIAMWAEPLLCDSYLVRFGGHAFFDYSIPLGFLGYLAVASSLSPREKQVKAA